MVHLKQIRYLFLLTSAVTTLLTQEIAAEERPVEAEKAPVLQEPFTGKIIGKRVRMRLEPSVESQIIQELPEGEMVIVSGVQNDFYSVIPPKNFKGYVFRTYVIDDVVEGNHVNVRSEPSLEAPVLAQLNRGDKIEGHISPANNKWLQVRLPQEVKFFVATEFVEKVGDIHYLKKLEQREEEAQKAVERAYSIGQQELCKPYPDISIAIALQGLREAASNYSDIELQRNRAHDYIAEMKESYTRKKIEYLEKEATAASETWNSRYQNLSDQMEAQSVHLDALERSIQAKDATELPNEPQVTEPSVGKEYALSSTMKSWLPAETALYQKWLQLHPKKSVEEYYEIQRDTAVRMHGSVQPYRRVVKNRPGSYLLVDQIDNIPTAFLYSTQVDLDQLAGRVATLLLSPRPNNHFAFPAYYVLDVIYP